MLGANGDGVFLDRLFLHQYNEFLHEARNYLKLGWFA